MPGKTFLVGEYLALKGGPSVLACTEPRFVLNMYPKKDRTPSPEVFHSESPAGKFIKDHAKFFAHWNMEFHDGYNGIGGFGASTAQFALVYMAELIMRAGEINSENMQWSELLRDYHLYAYTGEGEPPSGADLIAQLTGGIVLYDGQKMDVQSYEWPFKDYGFLLFHTGNKVATHQHLKSKLLIPIEELRVILQQANKALIAGNIEPFASAVQAYSECLDKHGLLAPDSAAKLKFLRENSAVVAAKGCGAMGADVLLAIYKKQEGFMKAEDWRTWLNDAANSLGLNLVASEETMSAGLRVSEIE